VSFRVRYTRAAKEDLQRLYLFLLERDLEAARRAREAIAKSLEFLQNFPFTCRKATADNPFLREMIIPFDSGGYVALFEIEDNETVTILAIRHQREEDYF
jgi:plasmid stabilization system protein ParE